MFLEKWVHLQSRIVSISHCASRIAQLIPSLISSSLTLQFYKLVFSIQKWQRHHTQKTHERRLLLIIFWKAACVSVTPYLVQLTFSLEACSWKNGDLVFQCLSFFSIVWWVRRRSGGWRSTIYKLTYNTQDMYGDRWPLCQETSLAKKMKRHLKNDKKRTI